MTMADYLAGVTQSFLAIFAALFPIINPPGTALLFLGMTRRYSRDERAVLSKLVAIYTGIIILASLTIGGYVLNIFGISIPVLRVAGGGVVILIGWQMLGAPPEDEHVSAEPIHPAGRNVAFYPLTMPLTAGPGTIAICVALGTARPEGTGILQGFGLGTLLAVLAIGALIYVCFKYADRIEKVIGKAGSEAFSKLFSFILICIGVGTFWSGFSELWASLPPK
jgi:multiple antibiotic resistance protein